MEYQNFLKSYEADIEKASGMIKQYLTLKRENQDCLILFRVGDFYETYFEDACILSNICGFALTKKKFKNFDEIPLSGFNQSKLDVYVEKLINSGVKVSVAEQMGSKEDLKKGEILEREIVRTYSKGTIIEEAFLDGNFNNFLAAVLNEGEAYGFSYCDVSTGEFFMTEGKLEEILCELSKVNPSELLLKAKEGGLEADIDESVFKNYPFTLVEEDLFNNEFSKENLLEYKTGLKCVNAILNYANKTQKKFMPKFNEVKKYSIQSKLIMNAKTRENLELNKNLHDKKRFGSICWTQDKCKTFMGKRLLNFWLNEPLFNLCEIEERLLGVEELTKNPEKLEKLQNILENISDTLRLSSKLSNGTVTPRELLDIKFSLRMMGEFNKLCSSFESGILNKRYEEETLLNFYDILERTIPDELSGNIKTGGIIKEGANSTLDTLKAQISSLEGKILEYEVELQNLSKIKKLKINYKKNTGYSIDIPLISAKDFLNCTAGAICKQKTSTVQKFTTEKLSDLEEKLSSSKLKALELEYDTFVKLREYSKEITNYLREFSKEVAIKDVLSSFAKTALETNAVRPRFTYGYKYIVEKGASPVLLNLLNEVDRIDIYYDKDEKTKILTGANMSGKSTYLREQAALVILAQAGAFVPAESYEATLVDKIFLRMGSLDDTVNNNSAFMCEMLETKEILRNSTEKSLILFDELGKNTSSKEGAAIAYSVIKFITEKIGAKTTIATHFSNLDGLLDNPLIKDYKFEIINGKRTLKKGILKNSSALETAKIAGIPDEIITFAKGFNG